MVRLEEYMEAETFYTIREVAELTQHGFCWISTQLKLLHSDGKAVTVGVNPQLWMLTEKAYREGTEKQGKTGVDVE